eukprot:s295_g2.t1
MSADLFGPKQPLAGTFIDGVYQITDKVDGMLYAGHRLPDELPVVILGADLPIGRISVYDSLVLDSADVTFLQITPATWWKQIPPNHHDLSPHLVDLCAGTGAMSIGAKFLGGIPMLAVDWNELAVQHMTPNHAGHVMKLDITLRDSARKVHQACDHDPGTVFLGFPCQPHSVQGQQLGSRDPRAEVLWHGLRIAFMIQTQSMILECTPAAGANEEVRTWINMLAEAMGWAVLTTELDLQDVWPSKRHRWWALLLPHKWIHVGLPSWTFPSPFCSIGDVLADWGIWTSAEEELLQLTPHEVQCYGDPSYGHDQRLIDLRDVAATALHSYANALQQCPCGCRHKGFHPLTLRKGAVADWTLAYCHELLQQLRQTDGRLAPPTWSLDLQTANLPISMTVLGSSTARHLLQAERITLNWNECGTLLLNHQRLGLDASLSEAMDLDLRLHTEPGLPLRSPPVHPVVLAIQHHDQHHIHLVQPGQFIFEILSQLEIDGVQKVLTAEGKILTVDFRVWHPMSLRTLTVAPWHLAAGFFRCANGLPSSCHLGLHDGHIWHGLLSLLESATDFTGSVLKLHPALAQAILADTISVTHQHYVRDEFLSTSGKIVCIFEADGHWTLLLGEKQLGLLAWRHFDGLGFVTAMHAQRLAYQLSQILGLDFHPLIQLCHTPQLHSHTCGTVAL